MKLTPGERHSAVINYSKKKSELKSEAVCFHTWYMHKKKGNIMDTQQQHVDYVLNI